MIEIRNVTRRFGDRTAVDRVTLTIEPGQVFGIIGPNGAGKTTLFRLVCRLIRPDSGTIAVHGETGELAVKRLVGYLPEEHRLYEHMRALDYLTYFCRLLGLPRARARRVLEQVALADRANQRVSALSKGMRQKLSFARTLLSDPAVLVLDEPTYGLDPNTAREVRGWIRTEARTKTVLLSSHNLHEAQRVCDQVAILHRGRVVAQGTPRALISSIQDETILELAFSGDPRPVAAAVQTLPLLRPPEFDSDTVTLAFSNERNPYELLRGVLDAIEAQPEPIAITRIAPREPTLEDVFFQVTGERYEEADMARDSAPEEGS